MEHAIRSAFRRWMILHNEESRDRGYIRLPNWFRHYVRNSAEFHKLGGFK